MFSHVEAPTSLTFASLTSMTFQTSVSRNNTHQQYTFYNTHHYPNDIVYTDLYQLFDLLDKQPYIISTYIITLMVFLTSVKQKSDHLLKQSTSLDVFLVTPPDSERK